MSEPSSLDQAHSQFEESLIQMIQLDPDGTVLILKKQLVTLASALLELRDFDSTSEIRLAGDGDRAMTIHVAADREVGAEDQPIEMLLG